MAGLFDIIKDLQNGKQRLVTTENEKDYVPFMTNRAMSHHLDTVLYANDMNMSHHIDALLQHDYYFHAIRKVKRWAKWPKKEKDDEVLAISEYLDCSIDKAREAKRVLSDDNVKMIHKVILHERKQKSDN